MQKKRQKPAGIAEKVKNPSAKKLADKLEISERSIYRYMGSKASKGESKVFK